MSAYCALCGGEGHLAKDCKWQQERERLRQALAVAISMLCSSGLPLRDSLVLPTAEILAGVERRDPQDYFEAALIDRETMLQ